ncbi:RusA family crossover junction endodeoxyribonuclease [Chitinasiproducens palmae]|uniref:Crossover junction endodeoxyribonuclease RusA n=1 Tax=Chitinasiproducens palmae TaxID=1770053 RepID=A0A1H2PQU9_9BURK|nr:RusA family crossover junction endodeoxyribonuclease [Chitinasiproducens palmae]SDV49219.1 crossover junction endodeoxyribonuclease RusA [Chitinasiproducens palmae]
MDEIAAVRDSRNITSHGSIRLVLPYPPSVNAYWRHRSIRGGGVSVYVSAEGKAFKAQVAAIALAAGFRTPLAGRVAVAYTLYPRRPQDWQRRVRRLGDAWHDTVNCIDLDNAQKALLDALTGVAFVDDAWVRRIVAERAEPDGDARLVVTIAPIGAPDETVLTA